MVKDSDSDCKTRKSSIIPFAQDDNDENWKTTSYLVGNRSTCSGDG